MSLLQHAKFSQYMHANITSRGATLSRVSMTYDVLVIMHVTPQDPFGFWFFLLPGD